MAIEKAPSKNWELTLYEMQRKPQPLITDDSEIAICPLRLSNELKCPICLDFLSNTMATKECLHRFCSQCIVTALRSGNKECPACRKKLVSKRSLRRDVNFDAIIAKLFPYRKEYEAHQANVMAKQIRNSTRSSKTTSSDRQNNKLLDITEPQENANNNSSSNNETESGSSKDQSSTTSIYPLKYRNSMHTSATLQSDNNSSLQVDEELSVTASSEIVLPQIRVRQPSSESGGPETNCSSSITSELCSLIGNQGRENMIHTSNVTNDKMQYYTFSESTIDVVLEPLDGRTGKNKLNEPFTILVPEVATVGHLIEFLHIKRMEMPKLRRNNIDSEPSGKVFKTMHIIDEVTFNIYLGMTANEKKSLNSSQDPNRQSSSSIVRTSRKSMNRKLEPSDKLSQITNEYSINKKRSKKERIKQKSMDCSEFVVFYYQEVSLKNTGNSLEILN